MLLLFNDAESSHTLALSLLGNGSIHNFPLDLRNITLEYGFHFQERFQSNPLSMIEDASWYVPNTGIQRDLQTPTVKEEIRRYSSQYSARLSAHPNDLVVNLMEQPDNNRRCEDTCQMICQISSVTVVFFVLVLRFNFQSLVPESQKRPSTY
jgi:hypothetical protein